MFWEGTANSRTASRKLLQSLAVFKAKTASAVRVCSRPVHAIDTSYRLEDSIPLMGASSPAAATVPITSESTGPWTVSRTVIVWSCPPATLMVSVRTSSGSQELSRR